VQRSIPLFGTGSSSRRRMCSALVGRDGAGAWEAARGLRVILAFNGFAALRRTAALRTFVALRGRACFRAALAFGTLATGFQLSIPIHRGWYKANNGIIDMLSSSSSIIENRAVFALGYDDKKKLLIFRNSWGRQWGDKGYGYLPYQYFIDHLQDAWFAQPYGDGAVWGHLKPLGVTAPFVIRETPFLNLLGNPCILIAMAPHHPASASAVIGRGPSAAHP
jgi:hypothetical protein